jgi:NADPH-dependent curcumin reductase
VNTALGTDTARNDQIRLAARPSGLPTSEVWKHTQEDVPEPGEGQVVVRVTHLSLDPAMRGWMNEGRSYIPPVGIGDVMRALGAGEVACRRSTRRPCRSRPTCPRWA